MLKLKEILKTQPVWSFAILIMLLLSLYWAFVATDRYVSSAHVVLQTPDIAPPELNFSSMLSGASATNTADLLYLRDYLLSPDVLRLLDKDLDLRSHFSAESIDYFSRMDDGQGLPMETFHKYFLKRVAVDLDSYSNVLVVKASAFSPQIAQQIVTLLLEYGEQRMNQMGQRLAGEQVAFIEKQVAGLSNRLEEAQAAVLTYQDKEGLISPTAAAENATALVGELQNQVAKLQAQYTMLQSFQSARSPQVIKIKSEINALKQQIAKENAKLTALQGNALNKITADYQVLLLKAQFAQDIYSNSLATLEATRVEAARKLKQVSVLQSPSMPEYSIEPDRLYNITVTIIVLALISIILSLLLTIIRDHRD